MSEWSRKSERRGEGRSLLDLASEYPATVTYVAIVAYVVIFGWWAL